MRSKDLKYIDMEQFNALTNNIEETSKLLNGYCNGIINNKGVTA